MNEVSRDLIVNSYSKKKQALMVFLSLFILELATLFPFYNLYALFPPFYDLFRYVLTKLICSHS